MGAAGVRGESEATGSAGIGVVGLQGGSGAGVVGFTPGAVGGVVGASGSTGIAVAGSNPTGFACYFLGNVHVQGTLTKSAGAFRIDHPLDPAHKYLQHAFVESPEMLNVYNGNVRTNAKGFATVRLLRYFQALNRDFRYQFTTLGESGWDARAGVWREIRGNSFVIRTDRPLVKVSWQVTGVREDAYARAHRIQVELPKPATDLERRLRTQIRHVATG